MLLALHDKKGTVLSSASISLPYGLPAAVLMELTLSSRLAINNKKLVIIDTTPTGDDILDEALIKIKQSKRKKGPKHWVSKLGIKDLRARLLNRLVDRGILRGEQYKILWIIPSQCYKTKDANMKQKVTERIRTAVFGRSTSDPRTLVLISLVNACGLIDKIFSREERKDAQKRIKELVKSDLIGKAVSDTVAGIQAAIIATCAASVTAASSSS